MTKLAVYKIVKKHKLVRRFNSWWKCAEYCSEMIKKGADSSNYQIRYRK